MRGLFVEFKYVKWNSRVRRPYEQFHYYCRWSFVEHENVISKASPRHLDANSVTTERRSQSHAQNRCHLTDGGNNKKNIQRTNRGERKKSLTTTTTTTTSKERQNAKRRKRIHFYPLRERELENKMRQMARQQQQQHGQVEQSSESR